MFSRVVNGILDGKLTSMIDRCCQTSMFDGCLVVCSERFDGLTVNVLGRMFSSMGHGNHVALDRGGEVGLVGRD